MIEITVSLGRLEAAIKTAGTTTQDDLIVVRTTDAANKITYASSSDEIQINIAAGYGEITIVALGTQPLTLDAAEKCRVLNVARGNELEIGNITITGGKTSDEGGGIYNRGAITATNVAVSGNTAGFGGGIFNRGAFTATNVAVSGNTGSSNGGGIYNYGTFTATNVTVSGNTTGYDDDDNMGGEYGVGGGIYNHYGSFTATNSLISGNYDKYGAHFFGSLSESSANNLIGYNARFVVAPEFDANGVLTNADAIDLRLRSDSSAIDAGKNDAISVETDVDGKSRVYNGTVDIGAYEYQGDRNDEPFYASVVDTLNDSFDLNDGEWSFREAIYYASQYETITFAKKLSGTITLALGELTINGALSIDGAGRIIIDADEKSRVLNVAGAGTADAPVALNGLTITGGKTKIKIVDGKCYDGGGIRNYCGAITATNVVVSGNTSGSGGYSGYGGGIYNAGTFTATNVVVSGNTSGSGGLGGGIYNYGTFTATNVAVSGNTCGSYGSGGGIYNYGTFAATNVTVSGNTCGSYGSGGGINVPKGTFTARNAIIALNKAKNGDDVNATGTLNAYNVLSSYAAWTTAENTLVYDAAKPLFVVAPIFNANGKLTNANALDLRLAENSQAIDAGNDAYVAGVETDLEGNARIQRTAVDLGAYERAAPVAERLETPKISSAEAGKNGIVVKWKKVSNASGYEIRYAVAGTDEYQTISVAAGKTQALLTGLDGSTKYSIRVKALGGGNGDSAYSASVEATTWRKTKTPTITGVEVTRGVVVKWSKVYGAASYTVTCVPVDASDAKTVSITFDGSKSQGLFNILRPETKYSITIKANPESSTASPSDVSQAVEITTNPMAEPQWGAGPFTGSKGITLKWKAVNGATGYQIEVREAGSNGAYNVTTVEAAGSTQTFVVTNIPSGVEKYEIRIKALGLDGFYSDSPHTVSELDAKILTTPKLTSTVVRKNGDLLVNWQKVYGAASYTVEYKLAGESEWTVISGVTNKAGNKTLTGLVPDGTYAIRVKAVGSGSYHDSAYSNEGTATTAKAAKSTAFVALDSVFADFGDEDDEFWTAF